MSYLDENFNEFDLDNFKFTEYTLEYMKEYLELKDIP